MKDKIFFTWLTNYSCNYRCPYCYCSNKWDEVLKRDRCFSREAILSSWARIKDRHGEVKICLSGGEPSRFPHFISLIKELSLMHLVGINTNLSFDVRELVDNCDPKRVNAGASFHPYMVTPEEMIKKVLFLAAHGWIVGVVCVGYPPLIPKLDSYRAYFRSRGINFSIAPFWGKYNGLDYPVSYTEEEKTVVNGCVARRDEGAFQVTPDKVKGKICRAGMVYAHIMPDGDVMRCGFGGEPMNRNFFDKDFSLLDKPGPCPVEHCGCMEWVFCE